MDFFISGVVFGGVFGYFLDGKLWFGGIFGSMGGFLDFWILFLIIFRSLGLILVLFGPEEGQKLSKRAQTKVRRVRHKCSKKGSKNWVNRRLLIKLMVRSVRIVPKRFNIVTKWRLLDSF